MLRARAAALALIFCTVPAAAQKEPLRAGDLLVENAYARATPGGAKVGAGYLRITNEGGVADRLLGGEAAFAGRVEIHATRAADGVMTMRQLGQLEIKPGESVELRPGADHLMFVDLAEPLIEHETRRIVLNFARAGRVEVELPVLGIGARPAPAPAHHH